MVTIAYTVALGLFLGIVVWKGHRTIAKSIDTTIAKLTNEIESASKLKDSALYELAEMQSQERVRREELATLIDTTEAKSTAMKADFENRFRVDSKHKEQAMTHRIDQMRERLENQFRDEIIEQSIIIVKETLSNVPETIQADTRHRVATFVERAKN